jgi:Copper binding proteins, plastocyanin/azurin family
VLERVVLRLDEHVQAEDGLEQRRVRMRNALGGERRELESNRHLILFLAKKLTRRKGRSILGSVRRLFAIIGLPIAAIAFFVANAGAEGELLIATVGTNDGTDIVLSHQDGRPVSELTPGTYTIRVRDRSRLHNFHLASNTDRTVDFRTELEFVGEQDFTVTFQDRTRYAYACEPHWQTMNGEFFVLSATSPPPPPPALRTLRASVTPGGRASLSARSVKAGRYRIVVRDRSRRHNFRLAGRGVNRTTGTDFAGSATWRVRLAKGVYRFGSDAKRLPGRLRAR